MDVKERILVKSEEMFMQFGIRSVSMDDIANNLGMSKKTLYQYFADKDELVDAAELKKNAWVVARMPRMRFMKYS